MPQGYVRLADGRFRAWVRVSAKADGFDRLRTKRFSSSTTRSEITAWRIRTREALTVQLDRERQRRAQMLGTATTGFRVDVLQHYLPAVTALVSYEQRVKDMALWIAEFGDRDRRTIQAIEIRAVRDRWLTVGPKRVQRTVAGTRRWEAITAPLSASSVNHRLRALSNFFTVIDPEAPNPVRRVPEASEPQAVPRAISYEVIRNVLDAMPDRGRPTKGQPRPTASLAKVRARVLAWAGVEPTELGRLSEQDLRDALVTSVLVMPGRHKGRDGGPGRLIPLSPEAVSAITDLVALGAWGPFSRHSVLHAWQRACVSVLGRTLRLKDLRHAFVTTIVASTRDLKLAQMLAGHRDDRTTRRYALAALLPMLRAGVDASFPTDKEK